MLYEVNFHNTLFQKGMLISDIDHIVHKISQQIYCIFGPFRLEIRKGGTG